MEHCEDKAPRTEKRGTGLREILEEGLVCEFSMGECGPMGAKIGSGGGGVKNLSYYNGLWPSTGLQCINRYVMVLKCYRRKCN